ncbi:MAG: 3-dehydroquinate synthase [Flavobacteriaceae bacterium]
MKPILAHNYTINFNVDAYGKLNNYIADNTVSKIFILSDTNTQKLCLPRLKEHLKTDKEIIYLVIPTGEKNKTIAQSTILWQKLCALKADRFSLLINLGGGIVTDLGGFVAATLKRGIRFINIPTTLLGMVDAAVGGKTGVNLGVLKNQIGCFANPSMLVIDTAYLETLPKRELKSGMAEIIKYGLSYDANLFNEILKNPSLNKAALESLIYRSVSIKNNVVLNDPTEKNIRKVLNFGHSLGHAVESYFLDSKEKPNLTHGESVAIGMVAACYLSHHYCAFDLKEATAIKKFTHSYFGKVAIDKSDYPALLELLKHDKKAQKDVVKFVLITKIGQYKLECVVSETLMKEALDFYNS